MFSKIMRRHSEAALTKHFFLIGEFELFAWDVFIQRIDEKQADVFQGVLFYFPGQGVPIFEDVYEGIE